MLPRAENDRCSSPSARTAITVNGQEKAMDVAPRLVDHGRTVLPARYASRRIGCHGRLG
ncbi:MAG: stalk domain-containing protein [Syntrophomonadaceae bacterium]